MNTSEKTKGKKMETKCHIENVKSLTVECNLLLKDVLTMEAHCIDSRNLQCEEASVQLQAAINIINIIQREMT